MQFLTISRLLPGVSGDSLAVLGQQESQRARTLYVEGHLRQIWYRDDTSGACLLWEADSEDQVRNMLATLPFAKAGLLEITIIPLRPYAGFGPQ
jgi:muconolactone delta-isomerase